jgi:hypothetical protein
MAFVISSCKDKKEEEPVDVTYNYFPVKTGSEWVYQVDSLVYDDNTGQTTIDTFTYKYKEVAGEAISASEFLLHRYYMPPSSTEWEQSNTWVICLDHFMGAKIQENTKYVKLQFPVKEGKTWNGNLFNSQGEEPYEAASFDQPYLEYPRTVKIKHYEEENKIEEIRRYEIYARDIGMISAVSDSLNTQVKGTRGFRFSLTLLSYTP